VEPAVVLTVGRTIHGPGAGAADVPGALTAIRSALVIRADPDGAGEGIGGTSGPGAHAVAVSARSLAFGDVDPGLLGFTVHAAGALRASGAVAAATGWIDAVAQLICRPEAPWWWDRSLPRCPSPSRRPLPRPSPASAR
jgi:hypothetical protein